jgi:DNA-binding FrmR family transcriptional regulator
MLKDKEKADLKLRLKKVAGQINGIDKMLDEGRYCIDVVQQILAARAALNRVSLIILESHAKSCVVTAIKENRAEESIEELMDVFKQLTK